MAGNAVRKARERGGGGNPDVQGLDTGLGMVGEQGGIAEVCAGDSVSVSLGALPLLPTLKTEPCWLGLHLIRGT